MELRHTGVTHVLLACPFLQALLKRSGCYQHARPTGPSGVSGVTYGFPLMWPAHSGLYYVDFEAMYVDFEAKALMMRQFNKKDEGACPGSRQHVSGFFASAKEAALVRCIFT